ncbi:hypothetical protein RRG08_034183 [Elysia crispata]|uniref:Uncharacterized protein n=1 Tax=Elysia crispata TaxID=231223 RepID=A0AAE1BBM8_9GAST|nr:hypothetical protein RRG08_034183 [Elysia crispata]
MGRYSQKRSVNTVKSWDAAPLVLQEEVVELFGLSTAVLRQGNDDMQEMASPELSPTKHRERQDNKGLNIPMEATLVEFIEWQLGTHSILKPEAKHFEVLTDILTTDFFTGSSHISGNCSKR